MIVFYAYKVDQNMAYLDADESMHCMKVLRKKHGGVVNFTDGKGTRYTGSILTNKREVVLTDLKVVEEFPPSTKIIIAISPTKNTSRLEWFVEKAVEIGVTDFIPMNCKRTERDRIKEERTQKIIVSAAKQSLHFHFPELHTMSDFRDIVEKYSKEDIAKFIASYDEKNEHLFMVEQSAKDNVILIGPEGDFTDEEIEVALASGFRKVNISKSRLRTETAGIVAAEILALKNELNV